jgi:hypothetical protein
VIKIYQLKNDSGFRFKKRRYRLSEFLLTKGNPWINYGKELEDKYDGISVDGSMGITISRCGEAILKAEFLN